MKHLNLRKISIDDITSLIKISKQTFIETFSSENSNENMVAYLENQFSIETLKNELTNPNTEFYFAELNKAVIGYLKVNFGNSQTEIKNENTLEIERIYVLEEFHGKKIGQQLFTKAVEIAKKKKVDFIWLGVWEHNRKAIQFYTKNGFIEFDKHIFKLGDDHQTDPMMKLTLNTKNEF